MSVSRISSQATRRSVAKREEVMLGSGPIKIPLLGNM
jgi:hypothetical protein